MRCNSYLILLIIFSPEFKQHQINFGRLNNLNYNSIQICQNNSQYQKLNSLLDKFDSTSNTNYNYYQPHNNLYTYNSANPMPYAMSPYANQSYKNIFNMFSNTNSQNKTDTTNNTTQNLQEITNNTRNYYLQARNYEQRARAERDRAASGSDKDYKLECSQNAQSDAQQARYASDQAYSTSLSGNEEAKNYAQRALALCS